MTKIKRKVQKNLPQLIEWLLESGKSECIVISSMNNIVQLEPYGVIRFSQKRFYSEEIFIVEVEEEITEETEFKSMVEVTTDGLLDVWGNANISAWKDVHSKEFHAYIDGEFKCIWRDGELVE